MGTRSSDTHFRFVRLTRFTLALSSLVLVSDLGGQVPLDSAVKTLKPGETVLIRVSGDDRIESRMISVQTEPLGLHLSGASAAVDAGAIDSLWVRGRATRGGTKIGAVVGGALLFLFGAAWCTALNEGICDQWGLVGVYSVVGAGTGALIGAGIGGLVPRWQLRFARIKW